MELESSLGNLYAYICYFKVDRMFEKKTGNNLDFSLFNYRGIRTVIPKGDVRVQHIYELMPFENKLIV